MLLPSVLLLLLQLKFKVSLWLDHHPPSVFYSTSGSNY
jgi:hypothetical protein